MEALDLPPNYRALSYGEPVKADDLEGNPRRFIGWKQVRAKIVNQKFCNCWGVVVIRAK